MGFVWGIARNTRAVIAYLGVSSTGPGRQDYSKKPQNSLGSSANPHPDAIDSETGFYLQSYCQRVIDVLSRKRSRLTDVLHIRAQGQPVRVGVGQRWQRDARGHAQQQASGQTVSRDTTCR